MLFLQRKNVLSYCRWESRGAVVQRRRRSMPVPFLALPDSVELRFCSLRVRLFCQPCLALGRLSKLGALE
jgi:hypothetical protein